MLRSEIPSGMCTKLRTVTASNNRDHARNLSSRTLVNKLNRSHVNISSATTSQSLLLLLARATYIMVLFFTHIPFVVNHTINVTPPERLQQLQKVATSGQKVVRAGLKASLCLVFGTTKQCKNGRRHFKEGNLFQRHCEREVVTRFSTSTC